MDEVQRSRVTPAQGMSTTRQQCTSGTFMEMEEAKRPGKATRAPSTDKSEGFTNIDFTTYGGAFRHKGKEEKLSEQEKEEFNIMRANPRPKHEHEPLCLRCSLLDFPNTRAGMESMFAACLDGSVQECEHFHADSDCACRREQIKGEVAFARLTLPGQIDLKFDSQLAQYLRYKNMVCDRVGSFSDFCLKGFMLAFPANVEGLRELKHRVHGLTDEQVGKFRHKFDECGVCKSGMPNSEFPFLTTSGAQTVPEPDEASIPTNATSRLDVATDPAMSDPVEDCCYEHMNGNNPTHVCEDEGVDEHTPLLSLQCDDDAATSTAPIEAMGTHTGEEVSVQVTPTHGFKRLPRKQGTRGDRRRYAVELQRKAEEEKREGIADGIRAQRIAETEKFEHVADQYTGAISEGAHASRVSNSLITYVGSCSAEFEAYRALGERLGRQRHIPDRTDAEDGFHLKTVWKTYSRAGHSRGGILLTVVGLGLIPILYEVADVIFSVVGPWQVIEGVMLFGVRHLVSLFITGYYCVLFVYIINLLWDYRITIVAPRLFETGEQVLVTTSAGLEEDNRPYSNKVGTPELPALYVGVNSVDTTLLWFLIYRAITLFRCDAPYTTIARFWGGGMRMVRDEDGIVTTSLARYSEIRTVLSYELLLQLNSPRVQVCARWTDVVAQALQSVRREVCINSDVNILNRFDAVDQTTLQYALIRHVTSGSRARMESFEHLN